MNNFVRNYKSQDYQNGKRKAEDSTNKDSATGIYVKEHILDTFCLVAVCFTTVITACNAVKVGWREMTRPNSGSKQPTPDFYGRDTQNRRSDGRNQRPQGNRFVSDNPRFREVRK